MIDPNKTHRIKATVINNGLEAIHDGVKHAIVYRPGEKKKVNGSRYLYVKFSIVSDAYIVWAYDR